MTSILAFLGGGLGALTRYLLVKISHALFGATFPMGILCVNTIGCFLMGGVIIYFQSRTSLPLTQTFIIVGFLGGFTTFSSFTYDYIHLFQRGDFLWGSFYLIGSLVFSAIAFLLGVKAILFLLK